MALRQRYPESQVVAAGHRRAPAQDVLESGPYCRLDVQDRAALYQVVRTYYIDTIYHLASVLSAVAPQDIAAEIRQSLPHVTITYAVDPVRQTIAETWPRSMDDSVARTEWGWCPHFTLATMTRDMLEKLARQLANQREISHGSA